MKMKKMMVMGMVGSMLIGMPGMVSADQIGKSPEKGDTFVTLGKDLTGEHKGKLLMEFGVIDDYSVLESSPVQYDYGIPEDVNVVEVSIDEERNYLSDYIPMEKIGNKSISSSHLEVKEKGFGIEVETNNITWVDEVMYRNALLTAGVEDAKVQVSAPFEVSGTGALTGILKAYDSYEDVVIDEEKKDVANQEMVTVASLGEEIGKEKANELITRLKEMIAEKSLDTKDQIMEELNIILEDMGITLTDAQKQELVDLLYKLSQLDIDWEKFGDQMENMKDEVLKVAEHLGTKGDEAKTFWNAIVDFFGATVDFFGSLFESEDTVTHEEEVHIEGEKSNTN